MRKTFVILVLFVLPLAVVAQEAPKAEAFGGYSYLRNNGRGLNGWEGQITGDLNQYLGITADFTGNYHSQSISIPGIGISAGAHSHLYNFLFGPTVTYRTSKYNVFGHALFGAAHSRLSGSFSVPIIGGTSSTVNTATAFGMALGGGVDINVTPMFAIRPAQVDYLYTRFDALDAVATGLSTSSSGGHQNSFRYSAGIVVRFGSH